jgi:hypothetical protein
MCYADFMASSGLYTTGLFTSIQPAYLPARDRQDFADPRKFFTVVTPYH